MSAGHDVAVWCIDGAWAVWLAIWVALSGRVKPVAARESLFRRAAHILPLLVAAFLLFYRTPHGDTWLERGLLPRRDWLVDAAAILVVTGLAFAVWARLILAGNWSGTVTLKHDHDLIRTGPYAWVRHPIYTGLLTAMLGNAVAIDERRGLLALAIITVAFLYKMRTEEAFMTQAFGDRYRDYADKVPALIPGIY
jgi:protein-S-isoprenylcysteine O-methyltransferase Ste14